jgi:hypothetical protein
MIITAVDDVIEVENFKLVLLNENDVLGIRLPESVLRLSKIAKVCLLRARYCDPFHAPLAGTRTK